MEIVVFEDVMKLDIRVGEVVAALEPEWSNKLLEFTVDFGADIGEKTILAGVKEWYQPADFLSKKYQFIVNLEPKKMGESVSEGMMLMADATEQPVPISVPEEIPVGTVIR